MRHEPRHPRREGAGRADVRRARQGVGVAFLLGAHDEIELEALRHPLGEVPPLEAIHRQVDERERLREREVRPGELRAVALLRDRVLDVLG